MRLRNGDAERPKERSHAEHGNEKNNRGRCTISNQQS
jgi:hypothetical protein